MPARCMLRRAILSEKGEPDGPASQRALFPTRCDRAHIVSTLSGGNEGHWKGCSPDHSEAVGEEWGSADGDGGSAGSAAAAAGCAGCSGEDPTWGAGWEKGEEADV